MSTLVVNAVGVAAGLCSIASLVPQIIKIWREKAAEGVSLVMLGVTVTTFALWTCYGALLGSWPIRWVQRHLSCVRHDDCLVAAQVRRWRSMTRTWSFGAVASVRR